MKSLHSVEPEDSLVIRYLRHIFPGHEWKENQAHEIEYRSTGLPIAGWYPLSGPILGEYQTAAEIWATRESAR